MTYSAFRASKSHRYRAVPLLPFSCTPCQHSQTPRTTPASPKPGGSQIQAQSSWWWSPWDLLWLAMEKTWLWSSVWPCPSQQELCCSLQLGWGHSLQVCTSSWQFGDWNTYLPQWSLQNKTRNARGFFLFYFSPPLTALSSIFSFASSWSFPI